MRDPLPSVFIPLDLSTRALDLDQAADRAALTRATDAVLVRRLSDRIAIRRRAIARRHDAAARSSVTAHGFARR